MGAYQLKITIKGSKPPIWRRILVPEGITFSKLHQVIQTAFSWSDEHLYQFEFRSEKIRVVPFEENESKKFQYIMAEESIDALVSGTNKFTYTYDFGDNWEHTIQVEDKIADYNEKSAQVIKFKGDIIPENCGGIAAFYELLEKSPENIKEYDMASVNLALNQSGQIQPEEVHIKEIYNYYDKDSIIEIAQRHGLSGVAKLKKEELIKQTTSHILDKDVMRRYFLCVRDSEIKLFDLVAEGNCEVHSDDIEELDFLYAGGYLTSGSDSHFVVAEEVVKAYQEINTLQFQEERSRLSTIGDYFCAANSLYAVTPPSVLLETFNKYEEKKLTFEELLRAYECLRPYRCLVQYIDGNFVDGALAEQKSYTDLLHMQKKVPYYIPSKQEIRFMADHDGFLMTSELEKLNHFLKVQMDLSDDTIPYILHQIQAEISLGGQLPEIMNDIEAAGIVLSETEQLEQFTSIITDVWNQTRMVLNRGHKPYEMVMKGLEEVSSQRKVAQKIYPNDPCPCGSGKKYKKCCGRKA
ncbi:plasmid pRiA4b ORF-3 family protein [Clostridium sp. HBUAS56010]|uniref:plasmid pRiA4b ORF-3 family protein n=1 Tax=Clostridium sp. HBUAS56010 TaxID=2571127 RepID=UPI0011787662|nr:plasmid pRiA4b ORF-3 family protein [Clostridium sp. HBUAS56010]